MSIDMGQFMETFFDESFEGLDVMEAGLLALRPGEADVETLHNVFRSAHSIKGGAGTFGLTAVSEFTHHAETLLDRLREGYQPVTAEAINALLNAVDALRNSLQALRAGEEPDAALLAEAQQRLEAELGTDEAPATGDGPTGETGADAGAAVAGWRIRFEPEPHLFATGNDPARLFRELANLGELEVACDTSELPPLPDLDPESCYLAWDLTLTGDVPEAEVREVFEFVEDDAGLELEPIASAAEEAGGEAAGGPADGDGGDAPARQGGGAGGGGKGSSGSSIRVDTEKIDTLIDMVGELVITQSMLSQIGKEFSEERLEELQDGLAQLERNTRELQENVMRIRMVPISFAYSRLPRIVHDASRNLGKEVDFRMEGDQTELDKTVMEKIIDPLVHIVRNSVDHGIEAPAERRAAGKPEQGTITIDAYHKGGNILIEIRDDGGGISRDKLIGKAQAAGLLDGDGSDLTDEQVFDYIFHPGLSTHDEATEYSGRGVGMDVVKRNVRSLGGHITVRSTAGEGTTMVISLPLTLSILDGQLFRVGDQTYIVPLVSVIESLQVAGDKVSGVAGRAELYHWREGYVPVLRLHDYFNVTPDRTELAGGLMVVVEEEERQLGLFVDDLLDQQQVVIKSLEANYLQVPGIAGATILGDGTVALILDVAGLAEMSRGGQRRPFIPEHDDDEAA